MLIVAACEGHSNEWRLWTLQLVEAPIFLEMRLTTLPYNCYHFGVAQHFVITKFKFFILIPFKIY